jgi:hypothetical protein
MEAVLTFHLIGAGLSGLFVIGAIVNLKKHLGYEPFLALSIAILATNQIVTGVFLLVLSPTASIAQVCLSGLVYLGIVGYAELRLVKNITTEKSMDS